MLRVLAICVEDPENIQGGMGRHVRELYRAMARRGDVEIDLLTSCSTGSAPVKKLDGYRKWGYPRVIAQKPPAPGMRSVLQNDIQWLGRLLDMAARGYRWDVIHAHEWSSVQVAHLASEAFGLPIVSTMHLCMAALQVHDRPMVETGAEPNHWSEVDIWTCNQEGKLLIETDHLILCSDAYIRVANEHYPLEAFGRKPTMIYNGIDLNEWYPESGDKWRARGAHQELGDRPIALFVGRIATMKGIEYLLEAVARKDTGFQVVIAGEVNADVGAEDWHVTKRLRALCKQYPERLAWVGFQRDQALKDLYAAATCVVMPSIHEPFGIVALEAMAMGVPLIPTMVDGLVEVAFETGADGSVTCYAKPIRPRDADAINEALSDVVDRDLLPIMREAGLERVKAFDWNKIADQTVGVYRQTVEEHQCR